MRKQLVLVLSLVGCALMPIVAQDKPQAPAASTPPAATGAARQIPLKVQLTLSRFMGEKKISSIPYVLGVLTNAQKTNLRMGVQVPVMPTVLGRATPRPFRKAVTPIGMSAPTSTVRHRTLGTACSTSSSPSRTPRLVSIDRRTPRTRRSCFAISLLSARSAPALPWSCAMGRRCSTCWRLIRSAAN